MGRGFKSLERHQKTTGDTMHKMKDQTKEFVVFHDRLDPNLKMMRKSALTDAMFEGFVYESDHNQETEIWVKE